MKYPIDSLNPGEAESFPDYTRRVHRFMQKHCSEALVHCEWSGGLPDWQTEADRHVPPQWRNLTPFVYCRTGTESPIVEVVLMDPCAPQTTRALVWHAKTFNDTVALLLLIHLTAAYHHLSIHPKLETLLTPSAP